MNIYMKGVNFAYDPSLVDIHQSMYKVWPNVNLFYIQLTTVVIKEISIPVCLLLTHKYQLNGTHQYIFICDENSPFPYQQVFNLT